MKQSRDFHRQVRVVYRACRRIYGKEKTQDECLKIFKIVFPELYRLRNSKEERAVIPEKVIDALSSLYAKWKPTGRLDDLFQHAWSMIELPMDWDRESLIQFYNDILPVVMRIRKLTPRECFRLMGVSEPDIDTMLESGISNSACYKLAGNSIVVDVMTALFDKMFVNTEEERIVGTQLSLF